MKVKITSVDSILCMPWHRRLAVSLSLKFWVQSEANLSGICGKQSGSGTGFSPNMSVFLPVSFHQCSILIHLSFTLHRVLVVYSIVNPSGMDSRMHFGIWYLRSENNVTCSHLYYF